MNSKIDGWGVWYLKNLYTHMILTLTKYYGHLIHSSYRFRKRSKLTRYIHLYPLSMIDLVIHAVLRNQNKYHLFRLKLLIKRFAEMKSRGSEYFEINIIYNIYIGKPCIARAVSVDRPKSRNPVWPVPFWLWYLTGDWWSHN